MNPGHMQSGQILIVEDEQSIADVVTTALRFHGHTVSHAADGHDGLRRARAATFDLLVLDVMLPGLTGFEICSQLRDEGDNTPVLFLTARDAPDDRVEGFVAGADDYLTKPFSVDELVLRVQAILRRTAGRTHDGDRTVIGDLVIERDGHEVRRGGTRIDLSATEYRLLDYLMTNAGVVLSKAQILVNVWDDELDRNENVVEIYIGYLRRKIDDGREPLIHTRRGVGYVLREPHR